ncbi:hypothetical protein FRC10_007520 [Ceratobasidium sp. 414]|nr:hypothetical protein FRC10_007520 [Ceratobasidium sp. 414]
MPDTAAAAAVALAAAAFLADSYPGGEHLLPKDREKRAVQVLQFYQANKPTNHTMSLLFTFGFTGLLSSLDFKSLATEVTFMPSLLAAAAGYIAPYVRSSGEVDIHTLPQSVPLADYLMISACRSLLLVAHYSFDHVNEPAIGVIYSNFMLQNLDIACADSRLYTAALKSLCYAQSNDLHDLCFKILDAQPVPVHLSQLPEAFKDHHFLERLCDTSLSSTAMPTVTSATTLHFKLLVATIILSTDCPLEDRQSLLRPILNCRHEFAGLEPSVPDHSLPGTESFLLHIQQGRSGESSIQQTMLHTMQYVVDFCHADPKLNPPANINPSKEPPTPDWRVTLQEIKNTHRLSSQIIRPSNVEPPSYTPTNVVSQGAQMPNDGRPNVTYPRVPNQTGWGSLNDSRPMPQLVSNVNALRTGPLNANPPYTNHEGPSSWGPPTQAPNRPSTPYGQMPEPNHYRPDPRLVVPSFGGPQVPAPQNPNYQNPAGPSPRVPGQPVRQWHSDMYPEPYQPTQNSAPNVPVPWQYSNRPEDNYLPGQMTMPRPEGYLHDLNNHSSNADCSGCQKSWGFEPPVETPRQRPVQNFELHGADLQEGTGLSSEHGDPGSYKRRNLPPLPHSPNDNTGLLYPLLGSDPEA